MFFRKKLIEFLIPLLIENHIPVNRTKIKKFLIFHKINTKYELNQVFTKSEFLQQYQAYEAMV